ncbi:uncharacterized protein LOC117315808 [Pecten maximus]|uniref:uncharacterized protein LOC117315808 n=1 Tax=Pecten maximus TaxID=6579 RepID=UPI001457F741|nr:uncharacterized protein LOC117315808 [Pecten maximus]
MTGKLKSTYRNYISDTSLDEPKTTAWRHSRLNLPYDVGSRPNRPSTNLNGQTGNIADGVEAFRDFVQSFHNNSIQTQNEQDNFSLDDPALQHGKEPVPLSTDENRDEEPFETHELDQENDDQTNPVIDGARPIYKDAPISVAVSLLMILTYAMTYHLSGEGTADLLLLIELHCISPNFCSKTFQMFTNYFRTLRAPLEFHHYCCECHHYYGLLKVDTCPGCKRQSQPKDPPSYFIVLPIIDQIRSLFGETTLMKEISDYKKLFLNHNDGNIRDILDGQLYKDRFSNGFFKDGGTNKNELHISVQMNTDGVSLFRSSSFNIWPVYFVINELPPHLRFTRNNRLFGGLWFGYTKPDFKVFMKPFAEMLRDFYNKGIVVDDIKIRGLLLNCVFDAPARCLFHNMVQFNGFHGCPYCMSPGESVKTSERGHTHAYPFDKSTATGHGETRTHQMLVEQGTAAEQDRLTGKVGNTFGVKGLTWFSFLPKFDMVRGVGIDYMHCVCLGVMKMLMSLWFDKSYRNELFSISGQLSAVNERLLSIRPPTYITRLPRTLLDIGHFKATEYKSFMLYYSLPCLFGILPEEYFEHFLLLVQAMFILLSDHITGEQLLRAKKMLMHFSINVPALYGERYMTSNVHLLLHLTDKVRDLGPLWATSCFYFEDFNGQLRTLFHGTQKIERQIVFAASVHQNLHKISSCIRYGSDEQELYRKLTEKRMCSKREKIADNMFIVGAVTTNFLTEMEQHAVTHKVGPYHRLLFFKRAYINGFIVQSKNYRTMTKRNNTVVQYGKMDFGQVIMFVKVFLQCPDAHFCTIICKCKTPVYLAVIDSISILPKQLSSDNKTVLQVSPACGILKAVNIKDITALCVSVPISKDLSFLAIPVNRVEKE